MLRVRKIQAPDVKSAQQQVRQFGSDAVILSMRDVDEAGTPGLDGPSAVDILADMPTSPTDGFIWPAARVSAPGRSAVMSAYARSAAPSSAVPSSLAGLPEPDQTDAASDVLSFSELLRRYSSGVPAGGAGESPGFDGVRSAPDRLPREKRPVVGGERGSGSSGNAGRAGAALRAAEEAYDTLRAIGLSSATAESALEYAIQQVPAGALSRSDLLVERAVRGILEQVPSAAFTAAALRGRAVGFAGMTGVGKTTALLRFASFLRLAGADVTVVGADLARPGAREQLLAGCMVLGLPLVLADSPDELDKSLTADAAGSIMLVDLPAGFGNIMASPIVQTAAQALSISAEWHEPRGGNVMLTTFMAGAPAPLLTLVVPAVTGDRDLQRLSQTARALGVTALAITKVDEVTGDEVWRSAGPGAVFNVMASLRLPPLLCSSGRDLHELVRPRSPTQLAAAALEAVPASPR